MSRKHPIPSNDLVKKAVDNHNAKVTVQYIQNQLFEKQERTNNHNIACSAAQDDLEIENIEYLEENANAEEFLEDPGDKEAFEDNFYPNAIHCLLDLYKTKYDTLNIQENTNVGLAHIWRDIAKEMQESLFEFNDHQIQHKYALLREQYFAVQTMEDIENFDYFEQLHDIYKDHSKENITKGLNDATGNSVYYKDEILLQQQHLENREINIHDFKSEEIVHKEHEFIDMVEKELQAMEDGINIEGNKDTAEDELPKTDDKRGIISNELKNIDTTIAQQPQSIKRTRSATETCETPTKKKLKSNEYFVFNEIEEPNCSSAKICPEFSLYLYNQEQERRHREKMSLLERSLQIQERALNQQKQLLQELIKQSKPYVYFVFITISAKNLIIYRKANLQSLPFVS